MNNIPFQQNTQKNLDFLAAQRQLYSDAKNLQTVSLVANVIIAAILSGLTIMLPSIKVYTVIWALATTILELSVLSHYQKTSQENAAKIQQLFDCAVLQLNRESLNTDFHIDPEIIIHAARKFKAKGNDMKNLEDWYPVDVGKVSIEKARIICQRTNIKWDSQLRRRYMQWIISGMVILIVSVSFIAVIKGETLANFFLIFLLPLMPIILFILRQYRDHGEAANKLDRIKEEINKVIYGMKNQQFTDQDLEQKAYSLQKQIYDNRRRSPLVFNWLYSHLKIDDEIIASKAAEYDIQELLQSP
jgi:hypothetical protein